MYVKSLALDVVAVRPEPEGRLVLVRALPGGGSGSALELCSRRGRHRRRRSSRPRLLRAEIIQINEGPVQYLDAVPLQAFRRMDRRQYEVDIAVLRLDLPVENLSTKKLHLLHGVVFKLVDKADVGVVLEDFPVFDVLDHVVPGDGASVLPLRKRQPLHRKPLLAGVPQLEEVLDLPPNLGPLVAARIAD